MKKVILVLMSGHLLLGCMSLGAKSGTQTMDENVPSKPLDNPLVDLNKTLLTSRAFKRSFQKKRLADPYGDVYFSRSPGELLIVDGQRLIHGTESWIAEESDAEKMTHIDSSGVSEWTLFDMTLLGASEKATGFELTQRSSVVNYFFGDNPDHWQMNVPVYESFGFADIYPSVDVIYQQENNLLEMNWRVRPGGNPDLIQLQFSGDYQFSIAATGIQAKSQVSTITLTPPMAYQVFNGKMVQVPISYRVISDNTVGFEVGDYDRNRLLVIDPFLLHTRLLGGRGSDHVRGAGLDEKGNIYVAGITTVGGFVNHEPIANALFDNFLGGGFDGYIAIFDPTGRRLINLTYFGGAGDDYITEMDISDRDHILVSGITMSRNLPVVNAFQARPVNVTGGFFTVFKPFLQNIIYSTYFGGENSDVTPETVTSFRFNGRHYGAIAGEADGDIALVNPFQEDRAGDFDGFISVFNYDLEGEESLVYSTYLGGEGVDWLLDIDATEDGSLFVVGQTRSQAFPTTENAFAPARRGDGWEGVFVWLDPFENDRRQIFNRFRNITLRYGSFFGTRPTDDQGGIETSFASVRNKNGVAYIVGETRDRIPLARNGAFLRKFGEGRNEDGILVVWNPTADGRAGLEYVSYFGGEQDDRLYDVAVGENGLVYFTGTSFSNDIPVVNRILPVRVRAENDEDDDALIGVIDVQQNGQASVQALDLFGGDDHDFGVKILARPLGAGVIDEVFVVGITFSNNFVRALNGIEDWTDIFVSRIWLRR